jgi:hypothetical protein
MTHINIGTGTTTFKTLMDQGRLLELIHTIRETLVAVGTAVEIAQYELDQAERQLTR